MVDGSISINFSAEIQCPIAGAASEGAELGEFSEFLGIGWWFGTVFLFQMIGNHPMIIPPDFSNIFFRGVGTTSEGLWMAWM